MSEPQPDRRRMTGVYLLVGDPEPVRVRAAPEDFLGVYALTGGGDAAGEGATCCRRQGFDSALGEGGMPRTTAELNKIANDVVGEVWSDSRLYVPVYRADIKTEAQAEAATDLPLLYIWNEVVEAGQLKRFSFSINGPIIGKMLERHLPRTDPDFVRVRDTIMNGIHASQNKVVMEVCAKAGKRPSELYGRR